ncbi:hypothetical protein RRG08_062733 [Elysia crispata]|uniref:ZSWIM1/3 RNaseH-like domain-containing protein n=1 Tax=Elysia crispata TaxID=231223 RepID=A0AAE1DKD6_9GAST|nr:hypothetical protein RRG08_062733 [Elysia crispata]
MKSGSSFLQTIKYDMVVYVCKQGDRRQKCTSSGVRPNQRSFKVGCPAKIRLVAVEENGICQLRVTTCHLHHSNHPVGPEIMKVFPEMRKPDSDNTLNKILALPSVSARDIQQYVQDTQNKVLFNSDVHNLRRKTNVNNMALLNVMCIDNNGQGRPVLHAFMQNECALYIESCLQFLEARFAAEQTLTIFIDKDMAEVIAIQAVFSIGQHPAMLLPCGICC